MIGSFYKFGLAVAALVSWANLADAAITTVAFYELGENDPGAISGGAGNTNSIATVGTDLVKTAGSPTYYTPAAGNGSTLAMALPGGSYYKRTDNGVYNLGTSNWGMEAWVNVTGAANGGWAVANGRMFIGQFSGLWHFHVNGLGNIATATIQAEQVGEWVHMAVVDQGGVKTAYLNGTPLTSVNRTVTFDFAFAIGARGDNGAESFQGRVDGVHLFTFNPGEFQVSDLGRTTMIPEPAGLAVLGMFGFLPLLRRRKV